MPSRWKKNYIFTTGVRILSRVYQIKSLDKPSFATSIVRVLFHELFHVLNMIRS
jgi:hypothetical protein